MIDKIEINLLPVEYRVHRKKVEIKREIAYPLIGIVIIAFGLVLYTAWIKNTITLLHNDIKLVQGTIEKNRPIQNEIVKLKTDKRTIQEKIKALELIDVNREKWVNLMEEISGRIPDFTWLVSIKEDGGEVPVIHLEGRTYSFPEVANYMSNLKNCAFVLNVDLSQIEQIDKKNKIFRFSISCKINPEASLMNMKATEQVAVTKSW